MRKGQWDQEEGMERRLRKLKGEAAEAGRCLGFGEKGHLTTQCPKVRYAKLVLKYLNWAMKEGYHPRGEEMLKEEAPLSLWHWRTVRTLVSVRQRRRTSEDLGESGNNSSSSPCQHP